MPKIVFIEPQAPNLHIFSQFPLPRLGALILGTMMKARGWEVEVYVEDLRRIDYEAIAGADLVGISTITSTAPRAYAIADRVRGMGIPVLMGGPHVTFLAEEALEHADYVIRGEGEKALAAFIDAWEGRRDFSGIPNLSLKVGRPGRPQPMLPMEKDLDAIPYPDFSLLKHDPGAGNSTPPIPVQTSRGCPFDCSFCSVTGMFGKKYRFRSTDNIIGELKRYDKRGNAVFFYDDNFAANPERTKELLRGHDPRAVPLPMDDPGPGRRHPGPRARPAHEKGGLPHRVHRVRIRQPREPRSHEEETDRGRPRPGVEDPPPQRDPHPRHVRPGLRRRRLGLHQEDRPVRQEGPAVDDPVPHPDPPAGVGALREAEVRAPPPVSATGRSTTPTTPSSSRPSCRSSTSRRPRCSATASSIR